MGKVPTSRQVFFTETLARLEKRKWRRCVSLGGDCLYAGIGCAIGMWIEDKELRNSMDAEHLTIGEITQGNGECGGKAKKALGRIASPSNIEFLEDMQMAHDFNIKSGSTAQPLWIESEKLWLKMSMKERYATIAEPYKLS